LTKIHSYIDCFQSTNIQAKELTVIKHQAKLLVFVRHGEPTVSTFIDNVYTQNLTPKGVSQINSTAAQIRRCIPGEMDTCIVSSTLDRAFLSAKLIDSFFGVKVEQDEWLAKDEGYLGQAMDFADEADAVIFVGHMTLSKELLSQYASTVLGKKLDCGYLEYGEAWVLNCINGMVSKISP
jgi:phosphohistidine phosphatase SixA